MMLEMILLLSLQLQLHPQPMLLLLEMITMSKRIRPALGQKVVENSHEWNEKNAAAIRLELDEITQETAEKFGGCMVAFC